MAAKSQVSGTMSRVQDAYPTLVKVSGLDELTDRDIDDFVSSFWEYADELPLSLQALLYQSQEQSSQGVAAYLLFAGWAIGRLNYVRGNPWSDPKHTWVANSDIN